MAIGEIYVKLAVAFADDPKVRALARFGPDAGLARDLFVQMICHCKRLLTDGHVPDEQIGLLVYPLDTEHGKQLAKQLASVGLIKEEAGGWQVLAYVRRNGTREDVERLSLVRAHAGSRGGTRSRKRPARSHPKASSKQVAYQDGEQSSSNTVSVSGSVSVGSTGRSQDPVEKILRPKRDLNEGRDDAMRLCVHLADRIEANCGERPQIGKRWLTAARLMLDNDHRTEEQVHKAIDWCQDDPFWWPNIASMPKLREKYVQLQAKARAAQGTGNAAGGSGPDRARGWMEAGRAFDAQAGRAGRELPT